MPPKLFQPPREEKMNRHDFMGALPFICSFDLFNRHYSEFINKNPYWTNNSRIYCEEYSKFLQARFPGAIADAFIIFDGNCCVTDDNDVQHFFFEDSNGHDPAQMKTKLVMIKLSGIYLAQQLEKHYFGDSILSYNTQSNDCTPSPKGEPSKKRRKQETIVVVGACDNLTENEKERIQVLEQSGLVSNKGKGNLELLEYVFLLSLILDNRCYYLDHTEIEKITKPILNMTAAPPSITESSSLSKTGPIIDEDILKEADQIYKAHLKKTNGLDTTDIESTPMKESETGDDDTTIPYLGITSSFVTLRFYHLLDEYEPQTDSDRISSKEEKISASYKTLNQCLSLILKYLKPLQASLLVNLVFGSSYDEQKVPSLQDITVTKWSNYLQLITDLRSHPVLLNSSNKSRTYPKWLQTDHEDVYYQSLSDLAQQYQQSLLPTKTLSVDKCKFNLQREESKQLKTIESMCEVFNSCDLTPLNTEQMQNLDKEIAKLRTLHETSIFSECIPAKAFSL